MPLLRDALDAPGAARAAGAHARSSRTRGCVDADRRAGARACRAQNVIAEPRPAGTAAALAWAAHEVDRRGVGPDAVMLSVHADWAIGDAEGFRDGADARRRRPRDAQRALVTVGVVPSRPDPGFGYIQPGEPAMGDGARRVARFIEKPDRDARRGDGARRLPVEFRDLRVACRRLPRRAARAHARKWRRSSRAHGDDIEAFFAAVATPISVDVGVLERSSRVLVMPGDFGWDDVGTWAALHRVRAHRRAGQRGVGPAACTAGASGNVVHAEDAAVVLYGVDDLVVVAQDGLMLVTTVDHAADLKTLIESLPADLREQHERHLPLRRCSARGASSRSRSRAPRARCAPGALLVRERWAQRARRAVAGYVTAAQLSGFDEPGAPPVARQWHPASRELARERAVRARSCPVRRSRCIGSDPRRRDACGGPPARGCRGHGLRRREGHPRIGGRDRRRCAHGAPESWWMREVWDYVGHLVPMLDARPPGARQRDVIRAPGRRHSRGRARAVFVEAGAEVEGGVCFDVSAGPVLVRRGAHVQAFTRLVGPLYVGPGCTVTTDKVAASSIGDVCKVHGEVSNTIFIGHANKGHDGFVGHSILGRWVNLGAGTITSNLKNTYGTVQLWTPGRRARDGPAVSGHAVRRSCEDRHRPAAHHRDACSAPVRTCTAATMPPKAVAPFCMGRGGRALRAPRSTSFSRWRSA